MYKLRIFQFFRIGQRTWDKRFHFFNGKSRAFVHNFYHNGKSSFCTQEQCKKNQTAQCDNILVRKRSTESHHLHVVVGHVVEVVRPHSLLRVGGENSFVVRQATHAVHSHSFPRVQYMAFQILTKFFNTTTIAWSSMLAQRYIKCTTLFRLAHNLV